ncbi:ethanolamine utilization microcompartment protein EutL [Bacillus sp. FJAT-45350]|uniref:ethanolamine utilization microcompartment protein EutL n=1 Tax=Bacillus sp. FJAT-45350 TaxID=2011014 RepID=UPI000BB6A815|nr:ethanolamine utilization microcompartment protein EutL [Bacillus sp. FJAT-45350]
MKLIPVYAEILAIRIIPNAHPQMISNLQLPSNHKSIGLFTITIDDIGMVALDEATKNADVEVVYSHSFYAGSSHSSGPLSGEFIGILSGPNPEEIKSGLETVCETVKSKAYFESFDQEHSHVLFAHVIPRTGKLLSREAGIKEGEAIAYLIAPPLEAMIGIDAALKAASVELSTLFKPPSETNFAGGLVTGSQSSCVAAAEAFRETVMSVANKPKQL